MRPLPCSLGLVALVALVACAAPPAPSPAFGPRPVREVEQWNVRAHGRPIGKLVLLQVEDVGRGFSFYQVRNEHGQWLGAIDRQGRVWQRVPFATTEVFRGAWPLARGVALLCEAAGEVEIVPEDGAAPAALDLARAR